MDLTIAPTYKQSLVWQKLFDYKTKFILFGGGAGGGKSWMIAEWLMYMCLKYPGTKWFMGREELKRLMASTFLTLMEVFKKHNIPREMWNLNGQYNYITFTNGSRIDLLDLKFLPSDPMYERFGSLEFTGGAIEEVGEVHFSAFDMLKSRIGRAKNKEYNIPSKVLLTCNPKKNWVYYQFYKPFKENTLEDDKCFIQSLYKDNPHTAAQYESNLASITDKVMKQRLKLGLWEYDSDASCLFSYDNLVNMFTNSFVLKQNEQKYLSVDVARFGSDKTIIILWQGFYVMQILEYEKKGTNIIIEELKRLAALHSIPRSHIVVDEDGVGGGVYDGLPGIKGFVNASRAYEPIKSTASKLPVHNFGNLKAQCYFALADKVSNNQIGIGTVSTDVKTKIIEDLEQIKKKDPDKDGKLYIVGKEEIKEILGRSPDFADAISMRMYFEVAQPSKLVFGRLDVGAPRK